MMNQSDAVDIYVLSVSDPGYAALLERTDVPEDMAPRLSRS